MPPLGVSKLPLLNGALVLAQGQLSNWMRSSHALTVGNSAQTAATRSARADDLQAGFDVPECTAVSSSITEKVGNAISNMKRRASMKVLSMWGVSLLPTSRDVAASRDNCKEKLGECLLACETFLGLPFDRSVGDDQLLDFVSKVDAAALNRWRSETPLSASISSCSARFAPRDGVDNLFATEGGREVYVGWSGRQREVATGATLGDTSILPPARLDAWIGTRCILMSVTASSALAVLVEAADDNSVNGREAVAGVLGKGGDANSRFSEVFASLLPEAVIALQTKARNVVESLSPAELRRSCTFVQACAGTEMQSERDLPDMHKNSTRQLPLSFECPPQGRACAGGDVDVALSSEGEDIDYVVLTAAAFSAHICFWIGDVRDAYVGVCKGDSLEYVFFLHRRGRGRWFTRMRWEQSSGPSNVTN
jgi:hypothetical protein